MVPREHTLSRLLRERGHHLTDLTMFARARAEAHAAEASMTMSVHDACEAWAEGRLPIERALALTGAANVPDLLVICDLCEVSRPLIEGPSAWQARRAALKARDAELDAARAHVPAGGPSDEAAIEAEAVQACRRHEEVVEIGRSAPDVPPEPGDELPGGEDYPPEAIAVLATLTPRTPGEDPLRDAGHAWAQEFLEDPREPLLPVTSPRVEAALRRIMRDCGFSEEQIRGRFPDGDEGP